MREKFARFGSFMIDMSIINMFAQVLYFYFFISSVYLTRTDIIVDMSVALFYILLIIVVAVTYQAICYHFLKNSFGKQLMRIKYYHVSGEQLTIKTVLRRELIKYYMIYVTIFIYLPYSFIRLYQKVSRPPYHEKMTETHVTWI